MQEIRTKRIRTGIILMIVSAVAMLVLAGLSEGQLHYLARIGEREGCMMQPSFRDRIEYMQLRLWQTGVVKSGFGRGDPVYAYLQYRYVFAVGMLLVGIGAILTVVGLTTPRTQP